MDKLTITEQINKKHITHSIRSLARELRCSPSTITNIRDKRNTAGVIFYCKLCWAIGLDPAEQIKNEEWY